jgi:hypothetical protein
MHNGGGIPPSFQSAGVARHLALLYDLLFNVEIQRDARNLLFSPMAVEVMQATHLTPLQVLDQHHKKGLHPAAMEDARKGYTHSLQSLRSLLRGARRKGASRRRTKRSDNLRRNLRARSENRRRQVALLFEWFQAQLANDPALRATFTGAGETMAELERTLRDWVTRYWLRALHAAGGGTGSPGSDPGGDPGEDPGGDLGGT